jgi:hypothetical protein
MISFVLFFFRVISVLKNPNIELVLILQKKNCWNALYIIYECLAYLRT